jgi:hypothetical protein
MATKPRTLPDGLSGRTDGTAVPAGVIGELRSGTATITPTNGAWVSSAALDTLPAGVWDLRLSFSQSDTKSDKLAVLISTDNAVSSSGTLVAGLGWETVSPSAMGSAALGFGSSIVPIQLITTGTSIYAKAYQDGATGGGVITCNFRAVRVV